MDFEAIDSRFLKYIIYSCIGLIVTFLRIFYVLKRIGRDPRNILPVNFAHRLRLPLIVFIIALALRIGAASSVFPGSSEGVIRHIATLMLIFSITGFALILVRVLKNGLIRKYDITAADNLSARRVYTQFNIWNAWQFSLSWYLP